VFQQAQKSPDASWLVIECFSLVEVHGPPHLRGEMWETQVLVNLKKKKSCRG